MLTTEQNSFNSKTSSTGVFILPFGRFIIGKSNMVAAKTKATTNDIKKYKERYFFIETNWREKDSIVPVKLVFLIQVFPEPAVE